ncbi:hypothetical protein HRI_003213700 [Hibiscus trionum]|uniref:SWIM-type domain-containing protein n=1 Tax=Hibiscus trionum TaxID=183268 RepID=A0A9W7IEN6_HIBTR|nr:hypothetical protein HRI_003213700 [Hibiscus trionum]
MSMFEIIGIVEKLEITYGVRVFWQVASNPLEVKLLVNDTDVLEMVRNLPTDHYVHLYLEEIVGFEEPETELNSGDDNVAFEAEGRVDSESDSEDEDYGAQSGSTTDVSRFSNSEDEFFSSDDEINNVNVGLGSEEVEVESDAADLEINNSHMFTFMTDRQKRLMDVVPELFPYAKHRTCVRHLYSNSKTNGFVGKTLKDQLWKAVRATYVREFESAMSNLKDLSETAWKWLAPKDPRMWSKSHFSIKCKSDMLLNNNCECFNKLILEARDKLIITLLELVRTKLMQRLAKRKELAEKWNGLLCPKIQKKLDHKTSLAHSCWPIYDGGHMYQVSCGPSNQHAVNIQAWTCSCRKWELTGIPCVHAISVILSLPDRPEKYVDPCYHVSTQRGIYSHLISPVRGENQ